jgi:TIR domain
MRAFLSHSSADKPLATLIYRSLRDEAVAVWFDRLELRAGDSLLKKIADGISSSDYLLALVTDNSKSSAWVEKEITIALTQEINGKGPKVIPLLLKGCDIPTILADKYYVTIDEHGGGIGEIIPAIFRDNYILDVLLKPDSLICDERNLQEELYEYTRTKFPELRVRIDNQHFNQKVIGIVNRTASLPGTPPPVIDQIKRISESFLIEFPIYWVTLPALVSELLNHIFNHYGKTMDAVKVAVKSTMRSLDFAQYEMCAHIHGAVFANYADQFGHPEIGAYVRRFEGIERHEEEKLVHTICQIAPGYDLAYVGIEGNHSRRVRDAKIQLPVSSRDDHLMLQMTCSPQELITCESWYFCCLPQIVGHFLQWATFRDTKPIHELDYSMGFSLGDYDRIGLA